MIYDHVSANSRPWNPTRALSDNPMIDRRGDIAEAEPAVPGWRMAVHDLCG
jgi:hypothetical protein